MKIRILGIDDPLINKLLIFGAVAITSQWLVIGALAISYLLPSSHYCKAAQPTLLFQRLANRPNRHKRGTKEQSRKVDDPMSETLTLDERIKRLSPKEAKRYSKLTGTPNNIATEGIIRHLAACDRTEIPADYRAVKEIIDDALNGKRTYAMAV